MNSEWINHKNTSTLYLNTDKKPTGSKCYSTSRIIYLHDTNQINVFYFKESPVPVHYRSRDNIVNTLRYIFPGKRIFIVATPRKCHGKDMYLNEFQFYGVCKHLPTPEEVEKTIHAFEDNWIFKEWDVNLYSRRIS